ncbi:MAG: YitT family protein, partial [Lachnospiraceae bacterium]|nr:YitT family protein [Lachnospiraceae bacterium]
MSGVISYISIVIGALLASFSVACILLPNDAVDYGTAGISIIISKLTGANLPLCVVLVFATFVIAGAFFLGIRFTLKAMVGSLVYTLGLAVFERIPFELNTEHFLAVAFGGAVLGFGLSIILRSGGCIDGSEILANI